MTPRHAQESRKMKAPASRKMAAAAVGKMTAFLENGPVLAVTAIAFGGSCGNIFKFFGACGTTGVFQYGDTALPDLLCYVALREIGRDRRTGRKPKFGFVTWPMILLVIGIFMTLALNYIGDDPRILKAIPHSAGVPLSGLLPGLVLLLALSVLHRRESGPVPASGTKPERRREAGTGTAPAKVPAVSAPMVSTAPAPAEVPAGEVQPWTDEDLIGEARQQWREHAAMGVRLSQARFEMALKQSPRGGAGRGRVIEALKVVRAEMDGVGQEEEAV